LIIGFDSTVSNDGIFWRVYLLKIKVVISHLFMDVVVLRNGVEGTELIGLLTELLGYAILLKIV